MIIAPTNRVGIDEEIYDLQVLMNGLPYTDLYVYGRIYRNQKDKVHVPEVFISELEYKQVFTDDTKGAIIGFYVLDRDIEFGTIGTATLQMIFTGILPKMSSKVGRYDEEVINETLKILSNNGYEFEKLKTGVEDVFNDFDKDSVKFRDMQPHLVFSIEIEVKYNINKC